MYLHYLLLTLLAVPLIACHGNGSGGDSDSSSSVPVVRPAPEEVRGEEELMPEEFIVEDEIGTEDEVILDDQIISEEEEANLGDGTSVEDEVESPLQSLILQAINKRIKGSLYERIIPAEHSFLEEHCVEIPNSLMSHNKARGAQYALLEFEGIKICYFSEEASEGDAAMSFGFAVESTKENCFENLGMETQFVAGDIICGITLLRLTTYEKAPKNEEALTEAVINYW